MENMQYRTDPKNGNRISALGFGCMRLINQREDLIVAAVKAGINYFDTAYIYPGNESSLGSILEKNNLRNQVFIADKLPHNKCRKYEDFDKLLGEQLGRLKTSYIDYYLIHNLGSVESWERLVKLGIKEWIDEKKGQGVLCNIGFSFHGKPTEFEPLLDSYNWGFALIQYNYMNENYQAGTAGLMALHERGMAAMVMEPLLGGKLANRLPKAAREVFAEGGEGTPASWAFKWLWNKPEITVVLSGMNSMPQLEENVVTASQSGVGCLSESQLEMYGKVADVMSEAYKIPCTGCNYCLPCPNGVNIPACFNAYNVSNTMGWMSAMPMYFNTVMGLNTKTKLAGPGNCTQCGACTRNCPQNIDIPEELKKVGKRMEPLPVKAVLAIAKKVM